MIGKAALAVVNIFLRPSFCIVRFLWWRLSFLFYWGWTVDFNLRFVRPTPIILGCSLLIIRDWAAVLGIGFCDWLFLWWYCKELSWPRDRLLLSMLLSVPVSSTKEDDLASTSISYSISYSISFSTEFSFSSHYLTSISTFMCEGAVTDLTKEFCSGLSFSMDDSLDFVLIESTWLSLIIVVACDRSAV